MRRAKRISETRFTGIPSNGSYEDSAVQFPISAECYGDVPRPLPSSRRNREGLLVGSGNAIVRHQNARYAPQRIAKQRSTERPLCANGICVPVPGSRSFAAAVRAPWPGACRRRGRIDAAESVLIWHQPGGSDHLHGSAPRSGCGAVFASYLPARRASAVDSGRDVTGGVDFASPTRVAGVRRQVELTCGGLEIHPYGGVDNAAQDAILPYKS